MNNQSLREALEEILDCTCCTDKVDQILSLVLSKIPEKRDKKSRTDKGVYCKKCKQYKGLRSYMEEDVECEIKYCDMCGSKLVDKDWVIEEYHPTDIGFNQAIDQFKEGLGL